MLAVLAGGFWISRPRETIRVQNVSSLEEFAGMPGERKTLAVVQEDCSNCRLLKQALEQGISGEGVLYCLEMTSANREEILDAVSLTVVPSFIRLEKGETSVFVIRNWDQISREVQNIIFR